MSSQITGYCFALSLFAGDAIEKAEIFGMTVPLPKSFDYGGIIREPVSRYSQHFANWFKWFIHTVDIAEAYQADPKGAPRYTHSCNRYFRPCAMIPYCDAEEDEQDDIMMDMYIDEWSPLHEKAAGD